MNLFIGDKIKSIRKKKGLTQEQLAKKCNISKNGLWNYENNHREPRLDTLKAIAKALDIDINELLEEKSITVVKTNSYEYTIGRTFQSLINTHEYTEEEINECIDTLIECFQILFLPVGSNPKEFQKENLILLNKTLSNIKELLELDTFLSPYKHPEQYMEKTGEIMKSLYDTLEKIRLYRFSKKREYRKMDL